MNKTQDPKLQIATDLERKRERERESWVFRQLREKGLGFRSKRVGFWLRFRERERESWVFSHEFRERELGFQPWI